MLNQKEETEKTVDAIIAYLGDCDLFVRNGAFKAVTEHLRDMLTAMPVCEYKVEIPKKLDKEMLSDLEYCWQLLEQQNYVLFVANFYGLLIKIKSVIPDNEEYLPAWMRHTLINMFMVTTKGEG